MSEQEQELTIDEAAAHLGVGRDSIKYYLKKGWLKGKKNKFTRRVFSVAELDALVVPEPGRKKSVKPSAQDTHPQSAHSSRGV